MLIEADKLYKGDFWRTFNLPDLWEEDRMKDDPTKGQERTFALDFGVSSVWIEKVGPDDDSDPGTLLWHVHTDCIETFLKRQYLSVRTEAACCVLSAVSKLFITRGGKYVGAEFQDSLNDALDRSKEVAEEVEELIGSCLDEVLGHHELISLDWLESATEVTELRETHG